MKIADIDLTIAEERALRRLLAQHITSEDIAAQAQADAELRARSDAESARADRIYETLTRLARETARQDGLTTLGDERQARAAWEAFVACEGWHSRYDVDEHWEPDVFDPDTWDLAYTAELEAMRREQKEARP